MKTNLFKLMVVLLFVATACTTTDVDDDKPVITEEQFEEHEKTWKEISDYIDSRELDNIDEVQQQLSNGMEGVKSVTKKGNSLFVTTTAGLKIQLDFTAYPKYNSAKFNATEVESQLNTFLAGEDFPTISDKTDKTSQYFSEELWTPQNQHTSRASGNKVRLSRRNVAVWCPWRSHYDFETDEDYIENCVKQTNKDKNVWVFNSFSPASFSSWGDFDLVVISAHGDEFGNLIIPLDCLGEDALTYIKEIETDRVWYHIGRFQKANGEWENVQCLVLSKDFYDKYLPKLSNTIVYTITCYAGTEKGELMTSVMEKDVADYFASDIQCTSEKILKEFSSFYPKLSKGVSSSKAFANGKGYFIGQVNANEKYMYSRYGKKDVSFYVPFAMGLYSSKTKSITTKAAESNSNTTRTVQCQIRCDKSKKSALNNVDAGICLKNLTTKKVEYIPFKSASIISSEIKDHKETSERTVVVELKDLSPDEDYMYCTYVKNGGETILSDECFPLNGLCPDENHPHAIDLGLPSGTKWACCNVGATSPEGYGGYYAWGETAEKSEYDAATYQHKEYCEVGWYDDPPGDGWYFDKANRFESRVYYRYKNLGNIAGTSYDVAHVKWGGQWRMPTLEQVKELVENCTWSKRVVINEIGGQLATGLNGRRIFLPAADFRYDTELPFRFYDGYYWSSTPYPSPSGRDGAYVLGFDSGGAYWYDTDIWGRDNGLSVRPVSE